MWKLKQCADLIIVHSISKKHICMLLLLPGELLLSVTLTYPTLWSKLGSLSNKWNLQSRQLHFNIELERMEEQWLLIRKQTKETKAKCLPFLVTIQSLLGRLVEKEALESGALFFKDMAADNISFGRLSSSQDNYIVVQPSPVTFFGALTPPSILAWSSLLCHSN